MKKRMLRAVGWMVTLAVCWSGISLWAQEKTPAPPPPSQTPGPIPMRRPAGPKPPSSVKPTLTCQAEKTRVLPGEILQIAAKAEGFDPDSLRYVWSADTGVLRGFGPMVMYDTAGLKPGVYEIVVDATDCYDENLRCSTSITVEPDCPPDVVPGIRLTPDRVSIIEGTNVDLECFGTSSFKAPIHYKWTTTAGTVVGSGERVRLDTSAVKAPALVNVTCVVTDKCGTANRVVPVTITAIPKPKPQPVNCVSGQFPYDSSRINNVDKACLDDLALRLQNEPAGALLITGYAAPNEHHRQALALSRAESAKAFLLKTHRIEARRIETRAAPEGSTVAPVDEPEGRRKNRALQITFLPAGSTL